MRDRPVSIPLPSWRYFAIAAMCLAGIAAVFCVSCRRAAPFIIAVIPRTTGTGLWEPAHAGAESAAAELKAQVYWNAPTRENDTEGQIALVDNVLSNRCQGLILAPAQTLALITPVRRAMAAGIPTVIVGSPLPIPAGRNLSYVLNDEQTAGRLAAQRVEMLLHGRGSVAVLGIDPDIAGIMTRARSFELYLSANDPGIHIVKKLGSFNALHEQQVAKTTMEQHPEIRVVVALTWPASRAALAAVAARGHAGSVIGFDPDETLPFGDAHLDSVVMEDTRAMGQRAVELIGAQRKRQTVPSVITIQPSLVTRQNKDTSAVRQLVTMDWKPGSWAGKEEP